MPQPSSLAPTSVVITGAGILTSMGCGWRVNADGFRAGSDALREIDLFDVSRQRTQRAGQAILPDALPDTLLTPRQIARLHRAEPMLLHSTAEALAQAGWNGETRKQSIPIVLGTSAAAMPFGEDYYKSAVAAPKKRVGQATRVHHYQPQRQASILADAFGIQGPVTMISNACASGANAIGHAMRLIRRGRANAVLCGGYDALCQMVFGGFDSLQALSTTQPRPFDVNRDGLALGEGAGMLILESREHAKARGAEILAEVAGYGATNDLHHLTQPHPDGDAALLSMTKACEDAGISHRDVGYINSHGTGTPLNDSAEANAIARWAGNDVEKVAVSSTKGSVGHLLGGAGAVETVISLMALREGWLPPNRGVEEVDPVVKFDLVREPRDQEFDVALTNSFGFGGANATIILRKEAA